MIHRDQALRSTRFSLILPSQAAIAEAKLQLNPFLANLAVSRRDCLWQRASLDRLVNNLKSAMITLAKHLIIIATIVPNQQLWQNLKVPLSANASNSDTFKD